MTRHFQRGLSLLDASMLIIGSMIGSGIFIVSSQIAADVQSPFLLLLNWVAAGVITVLCALSYGELAAAMPKAGGQYVYLKEAYNPLAGFLFGWTMFTVIQTGTIAAVGVAFAKFSGVFFPAISDSNILIDTHIPKFWETGGGNLTINTRQALAMLCILLLTASNFRHIKSGALVQNAFTFLKIASLLGLIILGVYYGLTGKVSNLQSETSNLKLETGIGIFFAAMVGSLFSADAWNNVTFTAGEVVNPQRNLPRSLILGVGTVILLYILVNVAYLLVLPFDQLKEAGRNGHPDVAAMFMKTLFGNVGQYMIAALVMVSTFGCLNGLILSGARIYYAMASDRLFFRRAEKLNRNNVPANALVFQAIWACCLALSGSYGNLLDYVMFATIFFYILTVGGLFILRVKRPEMERPYKVIGYPVVPALYLILASAFCISLLYYKPEFSVRGLVIVLLGIPVYYLTRLSRKNRSGEYKKLAED